MVLSLRGQRLVSIGQLAGLALLGLFLTGMPARAQTACYRPGSAAAGVASALQQLGYTVQCGSVSFSINAHGQCGTGSAINPSTCYGQYSLPGRNGSVLSNTFRLDDDEAILTLGTLPPPSMYYGYYTYVYERINPTVTPPAYVTIQAPVGPAMNERNADPGLHAQLGGSEHQLFGQGMVVLTTANITTQKEVASSLVSVYGAAQIKNMMYVEKLPVDIMELGTRSTADQLITAIRLTPFTTQLGQIDPVALQYMQKPPVTILRVSPGVPRTGQTSVTYKAASDPLPPTKVLPGRVWEKVLLSNAGVANANQALATIANNVIANRASQYQVLTETTQVQADTGLVGRTCLGAFESGLAAAEAIGQPMVVTQNMECRDASPDSVYYQIQQNSAMFPDGGEMVLIGVNHGTLGSATYSNIAVQKPTPYIATLTNLDLNGSANAFLDGTIPPSAAASFYVVSFRPDCSPGSRNCFYMDPNTPFTVYERAYLAPKTATAPDYTDVMLSMWLKFSPAIPALTLH